MSVNASPSWPYPGARWWKFDFHTHTPASKDTGAWQAAIRTPNELTPQTWLLKYMAAEIDCVAVTDHNTGEWIDRLKLAYAEMKREADAGTPPGGFRELHLFPGVEISVQGGFHLLAIFDPSATSQTISDLLAQVDYQGTRGDSDGVTRLGAAQVVERILAAGGLAIPAHVEGDKGLLQVEPGTRKCMMDANTVKAAFEQALLTQKKRLSQAGRGQAEFGGWFNKFLKAEADKRPEFIDHILCWFPEDGLQVEYSRKGDGRDFQSIGQASAGQRAAAMLAFLLAHGNEPLVLDQPEDDLDNHLIYGLVVQQIRSNKLRRQLIIVTHNPNIVVNGDAELIHVLDFNHQCHVKQTGSLQDQAMRREVCQVMEGGEEAFERRYQRLGREV
ncbi:MAG: hypothetical protein FHK80_09860 [Azoarcus sp. PHD]|nr:MAG: hypothetical protein FHK80_09860 [Azoarcus sp. PHD]